MQDRSRGLSKSSLQFVERYVLVVVLLRICDVVDKRCWSVNCKKAACKLGKRGGRR